MGATRLTLLKGILGLAMVFAALLLGRAALSADSAPLSADVVYKVSVASDDGSDDQWTEWIRGDGTAWRVEGGGTTKIYSADTFILSREEGTSIRRGSPAFLGYLVDQALSAQAARSYAEGGLTSRQRVDLSGEGLRVERGDRAFNARLVETVDSDTAEEMKLFDSPRESAANIDLELKVGDVPSNGVNAYWFGELAEGRMVKAAFQHDSPPLPGQAPGENRRREISAYVVFYETPGTVGTGAEPGRTPPAGELQVVSQPIDGEAAKGALDAFNGENHDATYPAWPRLDVILADGEKASLVLDLADGMSTPADGGEPRYASFSVITATTLVSVVGPVTKDEALALAGELRPVA